MIRENIQKIREEIGDAEILAATKSRSMEEVGEAIEEGIKIIGENRRDAIVERYNKLKNKNIEFHFIGHLQRNKVKDVVPITDLIQSLDSMKLARKIDKEAGKAEKVQDVLIQINIGKEDSKYGIMPEKTEKFVKKVEKLENTNIKGFMCIPPYSTYADKTRPYFKRMKKIFDRYDFEILSMGMSNDYRIAVEEGSTMVRIGTAIFGERKY